MKITENYLNQHGFKLFEGIYSKAESEKYTISIRRTVGDDSWQLSVFKQWTETYGRYKDVADDNDAMWFVGKVTEVEQIQDALIACGMIKKNIWRKRFPFFLVRGNKFQVHEWFGEEAIWTGFETDDYNAAMAEVNKRNKEHIRNI